jgi:biopolymer transport protein ExbB/TolQ
MSGIIDLISKGGLVMIPIFICSVAALAIIIERFIFFKKYFIDIEGFLTLSLNL